MRNEHQDRQPNEESRWLIKVSSFIGAQKMTSVGKMAQADSCDLECEVVAGIEGWQAEEFAFSRRVPCWLISDTSPPLEVTVIGAMESFVHRDPRWPLLSIDTRLPEWKMAPEKVSGFFLVPRATMTELEEALNLLLRSDPTLSSNERYKQVLDLMERGQRTVSPPNSAGANL